MSERRVRTHSLFPLLLVALLLPGLAQAAWKDRSGKAFTGENPLGVNRAEFRSAQEGMELIYQRRYPEALQVFEVAGLDFPDSPLGPVGRSIVYQAQMFENYDFTWDRVYLQEAAEAEDRFKRVARSNDQKAWNLFLLAVHQGVNAMYQVRHNDYLAGFNLAWEALENVKKVQRLAPDFHDVQLALGLYNYWRTAMTENIDYLPKFGDHREEGLAQMRVAREKGLLAPAPASLCLTYSYMESKRWDEAVQEAMWARQRYPTSILNELTIGRVYMGMKRYDDALSAFNQVVALAPENARVYWQIGEVHYKSRKDNEAAKAAYGRYIESKPLPEYKAHAHYRVGLVERRQRHFDEAIAALELAVATDPKFKAAATKLAEVKVERDKYAAREADRRDSPRSAESRTTKPTPVVPTKRTSANPSGT
jgi:tetratricopeptide (TPR) repeat protein